MTPGRQPVSPELVHALGALRAGTLALAAAGAVSLLPGAPPARWCLILLAAAHGPFVRALAWLYRIRPATPSVASARRKVFARATCTLCLMPFAVFWRDCPAVGFFAANALLATVAAMLLLVACLRLARAVARDEMQAFDARAAGCAVPLLFGAIALALAVAYAKAGLLSQPMDVLLPKLARLPRSVIFAGLLPHLSCAWALRRVRDGLLEELARKP
ncbi:MAG: hypothetical protein IJS32_04940 [Kiritimatiellae bacterium]|nr:hypothetical protein [Kiritimatiellia bacterium]